MALLNRRTTVILVLWIKEVLPFALSNKNMLLMDANGEDIADYVSSKKYVPPEKELPQMPLIKSIDNDATYLLSKLSDEELLKLLNDKPRKNDFSLSDIAKIAMNIKTDQDNIFQSPEENAQLNADSLNEKIRFRYVTNNGDEDRTYFRLNHKFVDNNIGHNNINYNALQKMKSLLNAYQETQIDEIYNSYNEDKKEFLFDILTAQLKSLCCKKIQKKSINKGQNNASANKVLPFWLDHRINPSTQKFMDIGSKEYMFLIMNDEIKSNGSDEILAVDPESLDSNSSVLLLGPVTKPLSDDQLKLVMKRISNELVKPEYHSLLQQLSDNVLIDNNRNIIKSFIFGPETRRYIKPHRCNQQSKLAKVYGGPKWIICTGYLNLNKPSLYD